MVNWYTIFFLLVATKKVKPPNKKRFEEDLEQISNRIRDLEIEQVCHKFHACLVFKKKMKYTMIKMIENISV